MAALILQLIAAFPQDLAAVEAFYTSVSGSWNATDKATVDKALADAKAADDADSAKMDSEA